MPNTEIFQAVLESARECVARGAQLLDENHSGWAEKIDQERLDMISEGHCVFGQLFGDYSTGCEIFRVSMGVDDFGLDMSVHYGFNALSVNESSTLDESAALDQAWAELIEERLVVLA